MAILRNDMSCYINANCAEGDDWLLQRNGVVGLHINKPRAGGGRNSYVCSGSLINNVRQDGTPFILSANHCFTGYDAETFTTMIFDFFKESVSDNCTDQSRTSPLTRTRRGATLIADIPIRGASDGTLLKLTDTIPSDWKVFFNGWDARGVPATRGVSIHHPDRMVKKISTFTQPLTSAGNLDFGDGIITGANTHWQVRWSATENGHSVTFGGSSGAPIFNENGHIVGTLSGGTSFCGVRDRNNPDFYGKFSYHWNQYSDTTQHFRRFLDPDNTGILVLDGFSPIGFVEGNAPIATDATDITATEFTANWERFPHATTYFLNVYRKGNEGEINFVREYELFDVGNVLSRTVIGLEKGTRYYFTVVASDGTLFSQTSNEVGLRTMMSAVFVDNHNITIRSISEADLTIHSITGQLLHSKSISAGDTPLPKNDFSVGVHFVRIGTEVHKILVW